MRKGEIACYKQFLLFSQCFPQLYIFSDGFKSSPNNNYLDRTKLKAFADDKLSFAVMMICLFGRVEKHCGKRRKYSLPEFSPFPTVFFKAPYLSVIKSRDCVAKIKTLFTGVFACMK